MALVAQIDAQQRFRRTCLPGIAAGAGDCRLLIQDECPASLIGLLTPELIGDDHDANRPRSLRPPE
jgi:hypothetical protein